MNVEVFVDTNVLLYTSRNGNLVRLTNVANVRT
jgi:hypothetical protein